MKKTSAAVVVAIAALALTGCSASQSTDDGAVQRWLEERAESTAGAAQLSGLAVKPDDQRTLDGAIAAGQAVRIDFESPQDVTSVQFECFGAETMDAGVYYESGSGQVGTGATDVRCADGPITIDVGREPLSAIAADGTNAEGLGAWSVTVR
ncbi:hypothetical protein [Microbacterium esteraromaticum]|uniref:hypothetical protein n=1 Tax=Microbacterium esteraromaticum TaxID=57043 RepID=UPI00195ABF45|nr:hypothetical protein [Microbacterium esteraromaticum]MBM7466403.1 hypothetical protein [Microbacterium esteraromaticum]